VGFKVTDKRSTLHFTQDKRNLVFSMRVSAGLGLHQGKLVKYKLRISSCTLRTTATS
jgi:hypothetical protein